MNEMPVITVLTLLTSHIRIPYDPLVFCCVVLTCAIRAKESLSDAHRETFEFFHADV